MPADDEPEQVSRIGVAYVNLCSSRCYLDFEQIETLQPTRIFSTLVKGISKARTKRMAAEREMVRPPIKYITTLRRREDEGVGDREAQVAVDVVQDGGYEVPE